MRIVSMVPSWTETLLYAGLNVVGRTRFCIHPESAKEIPVVGGTKDWKWDQIVTLKPDILVLDKEENPAFMGQQTEIPFVATHVTSLNDMPSSLKLLSSKLEAGTHQNSNSLLSLASEWELELTSSTASLNLKSEIPGILQWGLHPSKPIKKVIYIIWKNPWMTISADTFIGSVLSHCGMKDLVPTYPQKYPEIDLENLQDKESTLLLFSSEPFPFLKKQEGLKELGCPYAIVDGESFSWFGIRSLRFLQSLR